MARPKPLFLGFVALTALLFLLTPPGRPNNTRPPDGRTRDGLTSKVGTVTTSKVYLPLVYGPVYDRRSGVVVPGFYGLDGQAVLDSLQSGSYYQYEWGEAVRGKERIQMVARSYMSDAGLDDFIRSHPGQYWMIGNEPNVPNQDNLSASAYAQQHRYWTVRIKGIDPTAKIVNGGVANWPDNSGGLAYLAQFRESYRAAYGEYPPVDVWNIHAYPPFYMDGNKLRSYCDTTDPKRFISDVVRYLRQSGERQNIWLTEFGMAWSDDGDPCVASFMTDIVSWLKESRLVDRWYWFSLNATGDGFGGSLMELNGVLTPLGKTYRDLAVQ